MILEHNGKMVTFREFCLSEAIKPNETIYGTNLNRNDYEIDDYFGHDITFFGFDDKHYVVGITKSIGEVFFGVSSGNLTFNVKDYTHDKIQTRNAMKVFGKVMYVALQIAKENHHKVLRFEGSNPVLGRVYSKMVKNKIFLDGVLENGYEYIGEIDGEFLFKSI